MTTTLPPAAKRVLQLAEVEYPRQVQVPSAVTARGSVVVPPSKSVSHRFLNLALLSGVAMRVERLLLAEDTALFLGALEGMNYEVTVERQGNGLSVDLRPPSVPGPSTTPEPLEIFCGNAGTFYRFVVASLCAVPGEFVVDGTERLRERPIGALVDALRQLGAEIEYLGKDGFGPLRIVGGTLEGGKAVLDASESSQYLSAVLMASTRAKRAVEIEVVALSSAPYVNITLSALKFFGGAGVEQLSESHYRVSPGLDAPQLATVEGDYSAAAYPAAAAVLTGGRVLLEGLDENSTQGDKRFLELLVGFGGTVKWQEDGGLVVSGPGPEEVPSLQPLGVVDMGDIPDQVPTVAAIACFAEGRTEIVGVPHLRIKESDRLAAMASQLQKLGANIEERGDDLVIEGSVGWAMKPLAKKSEGLMETFNDHRIAMSLALVGLRRQGVSVNSPGVVAKSYPGFFDDLESLIHASTPPEKSTSNSSASGSSGPGS